MEKVKQEAKRLWTLAMTNYRQALRDLPSGLSTVEDVEAVTFPTKP